MDRGAWRATIHAVCNMDDLILSGTVRAAKGLTSYLYPYPYP